MTEKSAPGVLTESQQKALVRENEGLINAQMSYLRGRVAELAAENQALRDRLDASEEKVQPEERE
jgi:cell shape-determining protein MreC